MVLVPEVVALVHMVRAERLTPTSDALLSGKAYLMESLGKKHGAIVEGAVNDVAMLVFGDVSCVESWTCLFVIVQALLLKVKVPQNKDREGQSLIYSSLRSGIAFEQFAFHRASQRQRST